jgi:hypothetical protein
MVSEATFFEVDAGPLLADTLYSSSTSWKES